MAHCPKFAVLQGPALFLPALPLSTDFSTALVLPNSLHSYSVIAPCFDLASISPTSNSSLIPEPTVSRSLAKLYTVN